MRTHLIKKQIQSLIPPDGVIKVLNWTARDDEYVWRRTAGDEMQRAIETDQSYQTRLNPPMGDLRVTHGD